MSIRMFAAIDVGSFDLELGIYEISKKFGIREIDHLSHSLVLGRDTYNDGKISYALVEEMCGILNQFRQVMKGYGAEEYRAFASSALREARNSQIVLDQIQIRTGFHVVTINNSELRFKSYKALVALDREFKEAVKDGAAAVDVGFGSTQISLFDREVLISTQNLLLGALRISEMVAHWRTDSCSIPDLIDEMAEYELKQFRKMHLHDRRADTLIATGESINYMVKRGMGETGRTRFSAEEFRAFCQQLSRMPAESIEDQYDISQEYAAVLVPSAILYEKVLEVVGAKWVWAPGITLCDGIAAEYADSNHLVKFHHNFEDDILSSAREMAKRYKCSAAHSEEVERAAVMIFDATKKYHGMGDREKLLLQIASILHDCGKFVSITRGMESSSQIIMGTEMIGLSHLEREIVANVVRYNLQEFAYDGVVLESDLSRYEGLAVSKRNITTLIAKLTAILRLANAMDRSHTQKLSDSRIKIRDNTLVITTAYEGSIELERYFFGQRVDFFEEIFGIRPVLMRKKGV